MTPADMDALVKAAEVRAASLYDGLYIGTAGLVFDLCKALRKVMADIRHERALLVVTAGELEEARRERDEAVAMLREMRNTL